MNLSLLYKLWWKLEKESGLWQTIVYHKYLRKDSISSVKHKQTDSPIWTDHLKVKNIYMQGRKKCVQNGKSTLMWRDSWLHDEPLLLRYPDLFKLCEQKEVSIFQIINGLVPILFSRWLTDDLNADWNKIIDDIFQTQLTSDEDRVVWKLEKKGTFSVKST